MKTYNSVSNDIIQINLLPFRENQKKEKIRHQIYMFILFFSLISIGLLIYNSMLNNELKEITVKINNAKSEFRFEQKQANKVNNIQKILDRFKVETDMIDRLEQNRSHPAKLLYLITELIVKKQMWLTSFELVKKNIKLTGIALDNKTVADFMTRIQSRENFTNVRLKSTKQKKINENSNLKSFVLTFAISS